MVVDSAEGDEGGALEDAGGEGVEEGFRGVISFWDVEGLVEARLALMEWEDFVDGHFLPPGGEDIWYVRRRWGGWRGPEEGYYVEKEDDVADKSVGNGRYGIGLLITDISHVFDAQNIS